MELKMAELAICCSVAAGAKTTLGTLRVERLPIRTVGPAKRCAYIARMECQEQNFSGMRWGRDEGEEKQRLDFGGVRNLGGRNELVRRAITKLRYVPNSNSVAEAQNSSETLIPEVVDPESREDAVSNTDDRGDLQGEGESPSGDANLEMQGYKMSRICDRLIEVFMTEKTTPAQWRTLLALSQEWIRIRPHFYRRCKANAKTEHDPVKKRELLKLARQVKEVDENMIRQDKLLAEIEANAFGIDVLVAKRRKEFTGEFFEHLQTLCDASPGKKRQDEIAAIAGKCLSVIEAYDAVVQGGESIAEAQLKFDDILNSPSLEAATNKIDQLGKTKELDSALLLLITKSWAAAKESTTMKQEVKDIMFHIYNAAKTRMLQLVPDEIRIIKYLLSISDPRARFAAMTDSFAPGDELEEKNENKFHTTPEKLRHWIKLILDAYHTNKQSTMIKEAQKLMNPEVIFRLEILLEYMDETFI